MEYPVYSYAPGFFRYQGSTSRVHHKPIRILGYWT
jgi:hypothetical protein